VLAAVLGRELSPAHSAYFAEPVENPARGEIDWYTDSAAEMIPLPLADPAVQAAATAERSRLEQDIRALATRKRNSHSEGERFLGEMIGVALSIPSDDHVYVLGNRPVLVAWGHVLAGVLPAEQAAVVGYRQSAPTPMHILPPPGLPVAISLLRRWLFPILIAALLLPLFALLLIFLDPYGWFAVAGPECRIAEGQPALLAELQDTKGRESVLRAELAQETEAAGRRRLQCPPVLVQAPAPVESPSRPPSNDVRRAEEHGAHRGRLQIILAWEDRNDLDLYVGCPDGGLIFFKFRTACGGRLDVDANGDARIATATPVENVYFDEPPPGTYRVIVDPYEMRVGPESHFRVTIRREGDPDKVIEGIARNGQHGQVVTEVQVPP
jgi:hypothetical protein